MTARATLSSIVLVALLLTACASSSPAQQNAPVESKTQLDSVGAARSVPGVDGGAQAYQQARESAQGGAPSNAARAAAPASQSSGAPAAPATAPASPDDRSTELP